MRLAHHVFSWSAIAALAFADSAAAQPEVKLRANLEDVDVLTHPSLAFSPDSKTLVVSAFGKVQIIDVADAKLTHTYRTKSGLYARDACFSKDGKSLLLRSSSDAELIDTSTEKSLATLKVEDKVTSAAFNSKGQPVVVGHGGSVRLWDIASGKGQDVPALPGGVFAVHLGPEAKVVVVSYPDKGISYRLYDVESGKVTTTGKSPPSAGKLEAFGPDGRTLAWLDEANDVIYLTEAANGRVKCILKCTDFVSTVAFNHDASRFAAGVSKDKSIRIWDTSNGRLLAQPTHEEVVWGIRFSPDGKTLATVSNGVQLWDIAEKKK